MQKFYFASFFSKASEQSFNICTHMHGILQAYIIETHEKDVAGALHFELQRTIRSQVFPYHFSPCLFDIRDISCWFFV